MVTGVNMRVTFVLDEDRHFDVFLAPSDHVVHMATVRIVDLALKYFTPADTRRLAHGAFTDKSTHTCKKCKSSILIC